MIPLACALCRACPRGRRLRFGVSVSRPPALLLVVVGCVRVALAARVCSPHVAVGVACAPLVYVKCYLPTSTSQLYDDSWHR